MRIPVIHGIIDRRILVNFRVDPEYLASLLPSPLRPHLVSDYGMAGICLIRLKNLRPRWMPKVCGLRSENAAHRIAVEWDDCGERRTGVYIPRRDTSSRLSVWAGGRFFPGEHHHAHFGIDESHDTYHVQMSGADARTSIDVQGRLTDSLPCDSVFDSVADASNFYQCGSLGYSPNLRKNHLDGLELCTEKWHVQPLQMEWVRSSFFDNRQRFPAHSVCFDNALLMRGIQHRWYSRDSLPSSSPLADLAD